MNPAAILAAPEDAGKRLDSFLAASLPERLIRRDAQNDSQDIEHRLIPPAP